MKGLPSDRGLPNKLELYHPNSWRALQHPAWGFMVTTEAASISSISASSSSFSSGATASETAAVRSSCPSSQVDVPLVNFCGASFETFAAAHPSSSKAFGVGCGEQVGTGKDKLLRMVCISMRAAAASNKLVDVFSFQLGWMMGPFWVYLRLEARYTHLLGAHHSLSIRPHLGDSRSVARRLGYAPGRLPGQVTSTVRKREDSHLFLL